MGFPATTTDGETVEIVSTGRASNGSKLLIDAAGNKYAPSLSPLKVELVEAAAVLSEDAETVVEEIKEAAQEIGDAISELVEDAQEQAAEVLDAVEDLIPGGDEPVDPEPDGLPSAEETTL